MKRAKIILLLGILMVLMAGCRAESLGIEDMQQDLEDAGYTS